MEKLFKWKITIKLAIGTEIETIIEANSMAKAVNAMRYTAIKLHGEIIKIERDVEIENKEHSSDQ